MSTSKAPRSEPLTGADCFLWAFDGEVGRRNDASHVSQLVLRLGPGLDPAALEKLVGEVARAQPIVRAPIGRSLTLGAPVYRLERARRCPPPRVELHQAAGALAAELPELFFERLNDRLDSRRGELLRFDLVRYDSGETDLAMTWLHLLLDGAGSERFVRWLDDVARGIHGPEVRPEAPPRARGQAPAGFRERGRLAMRWQRHRQGFRARAPHSLAGPLRAVPQALRYTLESFDVETSARIVARAREQAGFLTPMLFYLAASIRAHQRVFRARGSDPVSFVVPLPVNLRAKGSDGAMFRSNISLLWFQVRPEDTRDLGGLIEELKSQRHAAIKEGLVEAGSAAMDFARYMPRRAYARMARRSLGGELCSFFFAFTDEFLPGLERFCGAQIRNGFHAPSVPASPGSSAVMSLREGRLNLTHVYQAGVMSDEERGLFMEQLRTDLVGS
jgi:hypothetical protein